MITEVLQLTDNPEVTLVTYLHDLYPEMQDADVRPAVLVIPGGGYRMCSDREAEPIALAYMAEGYQAFVLRYSVGEKAEFPTPLYDAETALETIRKNAEIWHVDSNKIAAVGFSAGGHLAACLGTMGRIRPAALVLGYTLTQGMKAGIVPYDIPDIVGRVDENTPPSFLFAAAKDPVVPMSNSLQFAQALDNAKVPFEIHIFKDGGHGFSLAKPHVASGDIAQTSDVLAQWFSLSIDWLHSVLGDFEVKEMTQKIPEPQKCTEYGVDVTLVTLWENEECRNILTKFIPVLERDEVRQPAMGFTIRTISAYSPDVFEGNILEKIDNELKNIKVSS